MLRHFALLMDQTKAKAAFLDKMAAAGRQKAGEADEGDDDEIVLIEEEAHAQAAGEEPKSAGAAASGLPVHLAHLPLSEREQGLFLTLLQVTGIDAGDATKARSAYRLLKDAAFDLERAANTFFERGLPVGK